MPLKDLAARAAYQRAQYATKRDLRLSWQKDYYESHHEEHAIRSAAWKAANRERNAQLQREYFARRRKFIQDIKSVPCSDCGGTFPPECMDFDHLEGEEKSFCIGEITKSNKGTLLAEIAKCDIVCANCHRIRTSRRLRETA
jgi:hypothetical protein